MNEELLKIYEDNVNEHGLPVFDLFTWQNLNTKYILWMNLSIILKKVKIN